MIKQCDHKFIVTDYNPKATTKFCTECRRWINTKYLDNIQSSDKTGEET